ncbi:MAG: aldolase/citrate lyase family protein [Pseudomonas sp.]|jgi:hypothetical protein|uniref:aldolase/citrate lyase family protein n=1 Tax=Pseudomonas sp. TaxID=306 RepID=UPI003C7D84F8
MQSDRLSRKTPPAISYLFVPGNRPERFSKAVEAGPDAIILDLEDAVHPDSKAAARAAIRAWQESTPKVACERYIRLNSVNSTLFRQDLAWLGDMHPLALEYDCSGNRHIREMLRVYGLRTSLFRLKVINALILAAQEGRLISVHGVHAYIEASFSQLPIVSVREVLKRLAEVGVITAQTDRSYSFTPEAWDMLEPYLAQRDSNSQIPATASHRCLNSLATSAP